MKFINKNPKMIAALGVIGGILIGVGIDNIGVGVALGIVFGISIHSTIEGKINKKENNKDM